MTVCVVTPVIESVTLELNRFLFVPYEICPVEGIFVVQVIVAVSRLVFAAGVAVKLSAVGFTVIVEVPETEPFVAVISEVPGATAKNSPLVGLIVPVAVVPLDQVKFPGIAIVAPF